MERRDAALALSRSEVNVDYEDISAEAVNITKKDILDTLGVAVAASKEPVSEEIVGLSREWGGKAESTILAFGDKVPAPMAAFINGTMAHALDYDDTHDKGIIHVGSSVVTASFAIAERLGKVNGKTLITAVALGDEMMCRMALATKAGPQTSGWHMTASYGYFGAAAAASKILALDESQVINAFGIAYSQSAGNMQCVIDNETALTKPLQVGFAAQGGVMSTLLSQKGLTGAQNSLEGRFGLFNLHHGGDYDRSALTDGLGEEFQMVNLSFKPYPCVRAAHLYIDAALQVVRDHNIRPEDIEEVTVFVNTEPHWLCYPLDLRRRPSEVVHAQFSIPYTVAVAILRGKVTIDDFTPKGIRDEKALAIAQKVTPKYDPTLSTRELPPARIEVKMNNGEIISSKLVTFAKGHPENPMSWDDLAAKFRDCAAHSIKPLRKGNIERVIDMTKNLDKVADVSEITQLLH